MTPSWTFQNVEVITLPPDCIGFVYLITNRLTDCKYIGKKLTQFSKINYRTIKKKDGTKKKKRIRSLIDSDWKTYWGSNDPLLADIKEFGEEKFTREILQLCSSKGECTYWENYYIFQSHALLSQNYYNQWTSCKVHRTHLKNLTERFSSSILGV